MIPGAHAAGVGVPAGLPADAARALAGRDVAVTAVRQAADTEPVTGLAAASSSRSSGLAGGQPRGLAADPPPGVVPAAISSASSTRMTSAGSRCASVVASTSGG